MKVFKGIPASVLKKINVGITHLPTAYYYHPFLPLRWFFWLRIKIMAGFLNYLPRGLESVLDLGGGSGVFLPTLSGLFKKTVCLDLWNEGAERVISYYHLDNVILEEADILDKYFSPDSFDVVIAADVLEHFQDPLPVVRKIVSWLKPGGKLIVSGPTESWLQKFGRKMLRLTPPDHYHTMKEIEGLLMKDGFLLKKRIFLPWCLSGGFLNNLSIATVLDLKK